jgi:choline dehydrogenase-like flavoprotein
MNPTVNAPYDAIVVGSGPGGASAARELSRRGLRVLILEQGSAAPLRGTLGHMARLAAIPGKGAFVHRDASLLVQGIGLGGSSSINFATAAEPPLARFGALGIDLAPALGALRAELPIGPLPDALVGPMGQRIMQGARSMGLEWNKLDKMIRAPLCRTACWRCAYGCPFGAKWSARELVDQAVLHGAHLQDGARALKVVIEHGKAVGVDYVRAGQRQHAAAGLVILAGGAIGSPRLLYRSALGPRTSAFFSDPVVAVMGSVDDLDGGAEVPMAAGLRLEPDGVTLADMTLPGPMYQAFTAQVGRFDRLFAHRKTLTLMVKIADQVGGAVGPRWVDKTLDPLDQARLAKGVGLAREVLAACGARNVFKSWHFAAHPGGSVPIGQALDSNLQAGAANLYVCDASVLPGPWGLPPTLTLLCLGQRLGMHLGA